MSAGLTNSHLQLILEELGWVGLFTLVDPEEVDDPDVAEHLESVQESFLTLADILLTPAQREDERLSPQAIRGRDELLDALDDEEEWGQWEVESISTEDIL